jgi:hypothetical protein
MNSSLTLCSPNPAHQEDSLQADPVLLRWTRAQRAYDISRLVRALEASHDY